MEEIMANEECTHDCSTCGASCASKKESLIEPCNSKSSIKKVIGVVSGKGGVGKTTLTGLMIQYLCENGKTPILAVDADANSNLNEVLGVEAPPTLGEIREEIERAGMALNSPIPAGMAKGDYLQMRLEDAITEEKDFDLMVMGRTQGQGCYCFVNGLVQTQIQRLQANYPYLVVDNEAGMEHISRGLLPTMDVAILVSDCSRRGVQAVAGGGDFHTLAQTFAGREHDAAHRRFVDVLRHLHRALGAFCGHGQPRP